MGEGGVCTTFPFSIAEGPLVAVFVDPGDMNDDDPLDRAYDGCRPSPGMYIE